MTPIERVKRIPLAPFVAPYTGGLKSTGRGFFVGFCPFHQTPQSGRPKFWVSSQHNICGCFNPGCRAYANTREDPTSKPLDIINFWALFRGVSIREAIEDLDQNFAGTRMRAGERGRVP